MIFLIIVSLICGGAALLRGICAAGLHDKMLAFNVFSTCMVMTIVMLGVFVDAEEFFIDISLMYACVGLISSVGFAKFFLYGGWNK